MESERRRERLARRAILLPSMGFLDDLDRWCLGVFLEKLPPDPNVFVTAVTSHGPVRWG